MKCPRCHNETETCALVPSEVRDALLAHQSVDAVFSRACEPCRAIFNQLLATPSLIENKIDPVELKKMVLWRSRGDFVKAGIMAFKDYNYEDSLLNYINYIKVLEETFGKTRSELTQKLFEEMGKADEFTTYLFVLWDLIAIYDRGQPEQQAQICAEFSNLIKGTSFVPTMARKARIAARTAKNPALYKQLNKELGGGRSCYIATAVFGNTFAAEVIALREFRDQVLEKSFWGRSLTRFYYLTAPSLAKVITKDSVLAHSLRKPLKLIATLVQPLTSSHQVEVYTDGGLKNGIGSWAYVIKMSDSLRFEGSGRIQTPTTSLRMEIQAAIEALTQIQDKFKNEYFENRLSIKIHTDSRVLTQLVEYRIPDWSSRGWIKKNGKPIADATYLKKLEALIKNHNIKWQWIPAHRGQIHNERCDELCTLARSLGGLEHREITPLN